MRCHRSGSAWQKAWSRPWDSIAGPWVVVNSTPEVPSDSDETPGTTEPTPTAAASATGLRAGTPVIAPVTVGPSKVRGNHPGSTPSASRISGDQSRAARSNSIVPEPSARSTACSPVSRRRTKSLGKSTCASAAQTSGSWPRSHSSLGAVNPGRASLPVIAIRRSRPTISRIASHSAAVRWSFHRIAGRRISSRSSSVTRPCIWPVRPTACTVEASASAVWSADRTAIRVASHQRPGSCSLHKGCGVS